MDYLLRASFKERMEGYEIGVRSRVIRPSEARVREDLSPDEELDQLSAQDHRSGHQRDGANNAPKEHAAGHSVRATLVMHDNAQRVLRREREAVSKLAKKHAENAEGWADGLRDFYEDHAGFVADTMRIPRTVARSYAAQHGALLESHGVGVMDDHWQRLEAEELTSLAMDAVTLGTVAA
jgi:hypothetical protein